MGTYLQPADLTAFADIPEARASEMIADAEAWAIVAAPCLATAEFQADMVMSAAARAVLRQAVLRWHEAGTGAVTQQAAGPFQQSVDTRQARKGMFWPSEISQLRDLCATFTGASTSGKAFSIDTTPAAAYTAAADYYYTGVPTIEGP